MNPERLARYFDHAATTPVDPDVAAAYSLALTSLPGNPHSQHSMGKEAEAAVERARASVAELIGAEDPAQILFTSGATESNNWVVGQFERVAISPFEHSSVREPAFACGAELIRNDRWELMNVPERADLVCVMTVQNETGALIELPHMVQQHVVLRDVTQHAGKLPLDVTHEKIHFASLSAHKMYAPKGVGALYCLDPVMIEPILVGGGQENGKRSGTVNVPGIVAMGEAARIASHRLGSDLQHALTLRSIVLDELVAVPDLMVTSPIGSSPYILGLSVGGVEAETVVLEMDAKGFCIGSGPACSTQSTEPSFALVALGLEETWLRGAIRISFGRRNTQESAAELGRTLKSCIFTIREQFAQIARNT